MYHRYDIHIKLRMKKSYSKKDIGDLLEYFMGVGNGILPKNFKEFFNARKSISIGMSEQHKD